MRTSVSQNTSYPSVCLEASTNDEVFGKFKTIPEYTQILEHATFEYGRLYIENIKKDNPQLLKEPYISKFIKNDSIGSAKVYDYGDGLIISPNTLKYINFLSDLIRIFGDLNGYKIAEIGGGYGGQCKIIKDYFEITDYHIVDLYEVNQLSKKYLNKLNVKNFRVSTSDELVKESYDLIISDYAYTELSRGLQEHYKHHIIDNSKNGYMHCNFLKHLMNGYNSYNVNELLNLNKNTQIIEEIPLTAPDNFLLIWKNEI
jgi:putative sugar O-methyltransferase